MMEIDPARGRQLSPPPAANRHAGGRDVREDLVATLSAVNDLSRELSRALSALLFTGLPDTATGVDFYEEVRRFETGLILSALRETGGKQCRAAALLGLKPTTLNNKIKAYDIAWRNPDAARA